jgi:hypothetical protein
MENAIKVKSSITAIDGGPGGLVTYNNKPKVTTTNDVYYKQTIYYPKSQKKVSQKYD